MTETLSSDTGPAGRREPPGGWIGPLLVVIVVALLASGLFSSDPEPELATAPVAPVGVADEPGAGPAGLVDDPDQAEFVEFGFDSQFGVVPPRGEPVAPVPALHPAEDGRPARQM